MIRVTIVDMKTFFEKFISLKNVVLLSESHDYLERLHRFGSAELY